MKKGFSSRGNHLSVGRRQLFPRTVIPRVEQIAIFIDSDDRIGVNSLEREVARCQSRIIEAVI